MTDLIEMRVTYHEAAAAQTAARALVAARLAACVHVGGPVTSTYWWDGQVQEGPEWMVTVKTRAELFRAVAEAVSAGHPYELPGICAVALSGTPDFTAWVKAETADAKA